MIRKPHRAATAGAALFATAALLGACNGEREAEATVGGAEAEVSTTLPESQVSDTQLEAAAEGAAAIAQTPQGSNTSVVVTPPSDQTGAASPGSADPATPPAQSSY